MHPSRMALAFTLAVAAPALALPSAPQSPKVPVLVEPLPPVRPLAELIAFASGKEAERLLAAGDWTRGAQAAQQLLLADAAEQAAEPSVVASELALLALAKAGLGDEPGAICRWHAAQAFDPDFVAADLAAYGSVGRLLEDHPFDEILKRKQGPPQRATKPREGEPPVLRPELLSQRKPEYTNPARRARVAGVVILEAVIRTDGTVSHPRILKGLPYGLSATSIDAVCDWRFKPATLNDEPVDAYYVLTVNFQVQEGPPVFSAVPPPPSP